MGKAHDLTGKRFGILTVVSREANSGHHTRWKCVCDCGQETVVMSSNLARGLSKSCGCISRTRKGQSNTRECRIWSKMIDRCHRPENDNYRWYGGNGKYVCQRWRESFEAFLEDLGKAPTENHTLDRINTLGSYTCGKCQECRYKSQPANCRWATKEQQVRNAKNNLWYTHRGRTLILKDWARESGIKYLTLYQRLERGWDFEKAITTPPRPIRS